MFNRGRPDIDAYQRNVGEDSSGSNEDSDILDGKKYLIIYLFIIEQIQYNIEDDEEIKNQIVTKNTHNTHDLNEVKKVRKNNDKNKNYNNTYNSKYKKSNYKGEDYNNYCENKESYYNNKKGKLVKKKNYASSNYVSYNDNYNNNYNNNYYTSNNKESGFVDYNYDNKKINNNEDVAEVKEGTNIKLSQEGVDNYDNYRNKNINNNLKNYSNKYDYYNGNVNSNVNANNDNRIITYNNTITADSTTGININDFVDKLNINAKEFVPKNSGKRLNNISGGYNFQYAGNY
jgi:hypothetical protein